MLIERVDASTFSQPARRPARTGFLIRGLRKASFAYLAAGYVIAAWRAREEAKALAWIQASFGKIAKPKRELPKLWTVEPTQDGERSFVVRRKGDIQIVALGYKVPSALHDDSDAIGFINFVLTDSPTGRLHKALVETGKAAQVTGFPLAGIDSTLHFVGAVIKKVKPSSRCRRN